MNIMTVEKAKETILQQFKDATVASISELATAYLTLCQAEDLEVRTDHQKRQLASLEQQKQAD